MKITVPNQYEGVESRAAIDPSTVKKLVAMGVKVAVASGLGRGAMHADDAYKDAGAEIIDGDAVWSDGDVVLTLNCPTDEQINKLSDQAVLVGMLAPLKHKQQMQAAASRNVTSFAAEFIPRISRAQAMDVLSSQANIAGYVMVVRGAVHCAKVFPMMMTAAGTIAPAKVFVIGAGVAGLQAIATAKRLGAQVEAYDVRPAVKEQVQSLGARFVELPTAGKDAETKGGYAREQTDEERKQQTELMSKHVIGADVVITTAAVFGKAPPMLIPNDVVKQMKQGAVLVDYAADAETGRGNCEATKPGEVVTTDNGVIVDGTLNLAGQAPVHATQMYAANMLAFLKLIIDTEGETPSVKIDREDEIITGAMITHGGEITNDMVKGDGG